LKQIFSIGYNYRTISAKDRVDFSYKGENVSDDLPQGLSSFAILKTCNRIEAYGEGDLSQGIAFFNNLVSIENKGASPILESKTGEEAVRYMFKVAGGLDSKLVGDAEILGQFKGAFQESKKRGMLSPFMERLINFCLQASKEIKNNTDISTGTTSLAYAVIHTLKKYSIKEGTKVLILGAGDFGKTILRYFTDHLPQTSISVANRTEAKARDITSRMDAEGISLSNAVNSLDLYDIIVSAVDTDRFNFRDKNLLLKEDALVFDLSVPHLFDHSKLNIDKKQFFTIEETSAIINDSFAARLDSLPIAKEIIEKHFQMFHEWSKLHSHSHEIHHFKSWVENKLTSCPYMSRLPQETKSEIIRQSTKHFAVYVREQIKADELTNSLMESYMKDSSVEKCDANCYIKELGQENRCMICNPSN